MFDSILRSLDHINNLRAVDGNSEMHPSPPSLVVLAHNSHCGDQRSTGYASLGQISLGQLCRETFGDDNIFLIGMTTYEGTVRAAHADRQGACYKGRGEVMRLKKAIVGSHEKILHSIAETMPCEEQAFGIYLRGMRVGDVGTNINSFNCYRPERFVGSCYLPQTEMMSHYTDCNLSTQFDYIIHVDNSSAITV
jgi:erythromycin esterase-like protein